MASPWGQKNIWSENAKNVIGGGLSSQRELLGSRGSDAASPKAVSGSAQLNHQSEAEIPRAWSQKTIWTNQDSTGQRRSGSGTASPSQARDVLGQQNIPKKSFGQNGNGLDGNVLNGNGLNGNGIGNRFASDYSQLAQHVPTLPSVRKQIESQTFPKPMMGFSGYPSYNNYNPQPAPVSTRQDLPRNLFESGGSRGSISRPSGPHQSASFPSSNGAPNRYSPTNQATFDDQLSSLVSRNLDLGGESIGPDRAGAAFLNPATQPFRHEPSSQTWDGESGINQAAFAQQYHPNQMNAAYADSRRPSHPDLRRGSTDRASPSSLHFPRNSPHYTPVHSNARVDSWPQLRSISRSSSVAHDYERSAPYASLHNNMPMDAGYYQNLYSQYSGHAPSFDPYAQAANLRSQQQSVNQYNIANQYLPYNVTHGQQGRHAERGIRSEVLDNYRASNSNSRSNSNGRRWELKHIYGHVVEFCGDQYGSRFIQDRMVSANSDEKDNLFNEILPNALQLTKDVFGNYVIQKFFEHGSQVQKTALARVMQGSIPDLSINMYACRVVQKALEHVLVDQQAEIVAELLQTDETLRMLIENQNGNHVIQKIILQVPEMCMPQLTKYCQGEVARLSPHKFGCRVIQRMLEKGTAEQKSVLMREIDDCATSLISNEFGNYVAQHVILHGDEVDRRRFIQLAIDRLLEYSCHKYASNVVEKCIVHSTPEERRTILKILITPDASSRHQLDKVMLDQFGNYVIQSLGNCLTGQDRREFVDEVEARIAILSKKPTSIKPSNNGYLERVLKCLHEKAPKSNVPAPLVIDSTSPTPALTSENCSPKTTSSPSTKSGDDTVPEPEKLSIEPNLGVAPKVVVDDGAEN
ncbi:mRNA binding protein puf3 [Pestalotiopsis sp. 9143b]|nr:mRNA binding protein puf3 [Pestalotiopsis sp. 9143b]